jgi:hypothetical protein
VVVMSWSSGVAFELCFKMVLSMVGLRVARVARKLKLGASFILLTGGLLNYQPSTNEKV